MRLFETLNIEMKWAAAFGAFALVVSVLVGLINGVPLSAVIVRGLILAVVFMGIGYGVIFIIRKFVPEMFEIIETGEGEEAPETVDVAEENADDANSDVSAKGGNLDEVTPGENMPETPPEDREKVKEHFTELSGEDFDKVASTDSTILNSSVDRESGKLGKHVIDESFYQYEPKVIAEAVRTMMSKDED